eukprot:scaffold9345_cov120-Cylindrotheca_fusiformis.AAC.5
MSFFFLRDRNQPEADEAPGTNVYATSGGILFTESTITQILRRVHTEKRTAICRAQKTTFLQTVVIYHASGRDYKSRLCRVVID